MNLEPNNLTDEQRRLLGGQAADELLRDERWLAARMQPAGLPDRLRVRLGEAVAAELARQRRAMPLRRRWPMGAAVAAAVLLGGLFVIIESIGPRPRGPAQADAAAVAQAQKAADVYVKTVGEDVVQLHEELSQLSLQIAAPDDNPWDAVVAAIEESAGQS